MSRFYDMYHFSTGELREVVVFPVGIIAYPDRSQSFMRDYLHQSFEEVSNLKGSSQDYVSYMKAGYPIIVYAKLDATWKRGDKLVHEDVTVQQLFIVELQRICGLLESAGIIHCDLRDMNIFYKSSISNNSNTPTMEIKVIDWDDSVRINHCVPYELLQANRGDIRFPHEGDITIATTLYHRYFIDYMRKEFVDSEVSENSYDSDDDP